MAYLLSRSVLQAAKPLASCMRGWSITTSVIVETNSPMVAALPQTGTQGARGPATVTPPRYVVVVQDYQCMSISMPLESSLRLQPLRLLLPAPLHLRLHPVRHQLPRQQIYHQAGLTVVAGLMAQMVGSCPRSSPTLQPTRLRRVSQLARGWACLLPV